MFARFRTPLFFVFLDWLFLVASRGAYRGYFSGDDLDNLAWTRSVGAGTFLTGLLSPQFYVTNFRPLGHFYWWAMQAAAGWDFRVYVAVLHGFHLLNVALLWRLLRRLGANWAPAACGAVFFAFHIAVFDAYWKPMYIFDVLCATFVLLALLAWLGDRMWWSLAAFWCAYKCKELAIALPLVLLAYEYLLGQRRWRRLLPFFAVSLLFGLQAVLRGGGAGGEYAIRLTPATAWHALDFYASQILLAPHLGFALLAVPLLVPDRRVWWGISVLCLFLAPMLLVPGRLFGAYLYLPLTGLAVTLAAIAGRYSWRWVAAALLVWLPVHYLRTRELRNVTLAQAEETKRYVRSIRDLAAESPDLRTFVLDGEPPHLMAWGVRGALRLAFGTDAVRTVEIASLSTGEEGAGAALLQ